MYKTECKHIGKMHAQTSKSSSVRIHSTNEGNIYKKNLLASTEFLSLFFESNELLYYVDCYKRTRSALSKPLISTGAAYEARSLMWMEFSLFHVLALATIRGNREGVDESELRKFMALTNEHTRYETSSPRINTIRLLSMSGNQEFREIINFKELNGRFF